MDFLGFLENNKNKVLNFGVIIFALFISFQIYNFSDQQVKSLILKKNDELKKNKISEEIAVLEKKIEGYKKVFVGRDMSFIIDTMSMIAKESLVKIVSIKPEGVEKSVDYIKSSFSISVSAPSYHSLGKFISLIENNKDIFLVEEVIISSKRENLSTVSDSTALDVSLKISTVSYL